MGKKTTERYRFIRLPTVLAMVGLSKSQVYKLMSEGRFPQRIRLTNRAVAWIEEQIIDWMNRRLHGAC